MTPTTPLDDIVRDVEKLIDTGKGDEQVYLTLPGGHPPLEGTALEVYPRLADLKTKYLEKVIADADVAKRIYVQKMMAYNQRSLDALKEGELTPEAQKTLGEIAERARELRKEMVKDKKFFASEIKAVDNQIAEIASMVHEPLDQSAGAGKAHGLNAKPDAVMKEVMFQDIEDRARKAKTTTMPIDQTSDVTDVIRQLKEKVASGEGHLHVTFPLTIKRGDDPGEGLAQTFEGPVHQVLAQLIDLRRTTIKYITSNTRKWLDQFKADAAFRDKMAEDFGSREAWLNLTGARVRNTRDEVLDLGAEFAREIQEMNGQLKELASLIREPLDQPAGAGKVHVLEERRLARDENEIRDFPLAQKIAKELNTDARELIKGITGQPLGKIVERMMDEALPEAMKAFYPRVYENTGRWSSPRACAAAMVNIIAETLRYGYERAATAYRLAMPGLTYLRERRMPMFFLAPDLMEAVLRTDFDDDINWVDLELPYETGILMLPRGSLIHPVDGEMCMILWSRIRQGEHPAPWPGIPSSVLPHDAFVILGLCMDRMMWYDSILTANRRPTMRLNNLFYREAGQPVPAVQKSNFMDSDLDEGDSEFVEKMGVLVFGTILAMNARPQLIEHGKLIKRVGKADKVREFWSPNVIGAKYKFKREVPRIVQGQFVTAGREHGTHASPRMHWRRGHYRNQPVGPGRKERKNIWIEPCLIGAE